jgi:L-asparaginase/beta-aspartyl-peptidase (threonine type)
MTYALVLHGGAGARLGVDYTVQKEHMRQLITAGQGMLVDGQSALDVVAWAIEEMEASGVFVAGKG